MSTDKTLKRNALALKYIHIYKSGAVFGSGERWVILTVFVHLFAKLDKKTTIKYINEHMVMHNRTNCKTVEHIRKEADEDQVSTPGKSKQEQLWSRQEQIMWWLH